MTETPDAKTFDLIGYLSTRDLPTREVRVPFDEELLLQVDELEAARNAVGLSAEEVLGLDLRMEELSERCKQESFVIKLKAVPEHVRRDLSDKIQKEFPSTKDAFGREEVHPEANTAFALATWAAYVVTVTSPGGGADTVGEEGAKALYDMAPTAVHIAINEGISHLIAGSTAGYQVVQDLNFLSDASPEG